MITLNAFAKLNLSLDVRQKRPDGYHELDGIMQSISLCDIVTMEKAQAITVEMDVGGVSMPSNTAYRAARLFADLTGIPGAAVRIQKRIPIEAGLGGASADAAAVLIGLNELYATRLDEEALASLGVKVGADVPFALTGGTARARGIGERLEPFSPGAHWHYVVLKPHAGVSTAEAFRRYRKSAPLHIDTVQYALAKGDMQLFLRYADNALGMAALSIAPEILGVAQALKAAGAPKALMSGSGSAMFAPFPTREQAEAAAKRVRGDFAHCGVYSACPAGVQIVDAEAGYDGV